MVPNIMVVDDERRIRKIICDYLINDGYNVIEAENGQRALDKLNEIKAIDLIILDVMMPDMNGWQTCKEIRRISDVPIIFLTALGEGSDEVHGLDIGADDYISKPFRYEVFMARVRSILRRHKKQNERVIKVNDVEIDTYSRTISVNSISVDLSPKEYELLLYLVNNQNIALERDKILDMVWSYDYFGDPRTVDTHIKNLRAKTGSLGLCIKTVRGFGYRLEVAD